MSARRHLQKELWGDSKADTADRPRSEVVADSGLLSGHDCLANRLHHIGLFSHPYRTL
jgi:hypothetical protein